MNDWKKALWKDVRNIGLMVLAVGSFVLFAQLPDDAVIKHIVAIIMLVLIVIAVLITTPLGNPIKRLIRKLMNKKDGQI